MRIAALVIGLIGGIVGLLIGFGFYSLYAVAAAATGLAQATLYQIISIASPVVCIVGAALALSRPLVAGVLMVFATLGMIITFGFGSWSFIPIILGAVGAVIAFLGANEGRPAAMPPA
jgi:hypothetical protein